MGLKGYKAHLVMTWKENLELLQLYQKPHKWYKLLKLHKNGSYALNKYITLYGANSYFGKKEIKGFNKVGSGITSW